MTTTARPAVLQNTVNAGSEQADVAVTMCTGTLFDVTSTPGFPDGQYMWTSANIMGQPVWQAGTWSINLWAPHFAAPGSTPDGLTHGNYSAWISPQNVQAMGLTLDQAAAGEIAVTRTDDGVTTPVAATVEQREGGVYIDIPDLTFSSPTLPRLHLCRQRGQPLPEAVVNWGPAIETNQTELFVEFEIAEATGIASTG